MLKDISQSKESVATIRKRKERTGRSFFIAWNNAEGVSCSCEVSELHEGGIFMKEASEVRGDM
jgi:hypothetical protein